MGVQAGLIPQWSKSLIMIVLENFQLWIGLHSFMTLWLNWLLENFILQQMIRAHLLIFHHHAHCWINSIFVSSNVPNGFFWMVNLGLKYYIFVKIKP